MLLAIFAVALYLRIRLPYAASVQGNSIVISDFDPYYHLRIVEYSVQHFPNVLAFDPYVDYPNGFWIGWPPLFDLLASAYALAAMSLFHVNYQVAVATFPAVLGALAIIPIYYITKTVFDWKAGILAAALLTVIPANLLRTMVGNLNHHVAAEVFFPAILLLFFMLALRGNLTFSRVRAFSFTREDKKTLLYAALAGVFTTALLLTWLGGFLFLGIISVFAVIQFIIYHIKRERSDNLTIVGITLLLVALLTILPVSVTSHFGNVIDTLHLSLFQPLLLALLLIVWCVFGLLALYMRNMRRIVYPLSICAFIVAASLLVYFVKPDLAVSVFTGYGFFTRSGVLQTVAEAQPLFGAQGFELNTVASYFQVLLFTGLIGLVVLLHRVYKKQDEAALLLVVWSVVAFAITVVQSRFTFLLSANVAILSGFVIAWIVDKLVGQAYGTLRDTGDAGSVRHLFGRDIKYTQLVGLFLVVLILLLPSINVTTAYAKNVPDISGDWAESLYWMRNNTPQTTNYDALSDQRPEYGVLSWWDYGNWIVFLGHRPAVANNFQTGVGDAAHFFTRQNESDTFSTIQNRNVKYVMTDYEIADAYGKFQAIALLSGQGVDSFFTTQPQVTSSGQVTEQAVPNDAYYNTTVVRLQDFDGNGYSHYRLIHESPTSIGTLGGTDVKAVKTFEYVKGATILVNGKGNATLSLNVTTNQNRTFNYTQSALLNGSHAFVVPYSTSGMPYGMQTGSAYTITVGNSTKSVAVSESDVVNGKQLNVSF
ncbi:MAG: oligosaccharyl transferase, archaeosortase A system-associated [Halobacteriota archaeon]